jgi:predicted RNase H-like HicB family nuclease
LRAVSVRVHAWIAPEEVTARIIQSNMINFLYQRKDIKRQFTAIIEKRGKWYVATVEEIPGVNTQGRTLAEARRNLKEALQLVVEANRELLCRDLGIPLPS